MAARQLDETFYDAFSCQTTKAGISNLDRSVHRSGIHYLEIPIRSDVFEIPVVALNTFISMTLADNNADAISVALLNYNRKATYTTPDRNMRDILIADWKTNHLVYMPVNSNGNVIDYYGSHGMLLDKDFRLLVVLSWQIRRIHETDEWDDRTRVMYQFVKPILRVDPICFSGSDPMMKWCANKLFKTGLAERVMFSCGNPMRRTFKLENVQSMFPSIIIEESPFNIRTPDVPDVLTTREEILQPVIDHIDELIQ